MSLNIIIILLVSLLGHLPTEGKPTNKPLVNLSVKPIAKPVAVSKTVNPLVKPPAKPISNPASKPSSKPTEKLFGKPSAKPISKPSAKVTEKPLWKPSAKLTEKPLSKPSAKPMSKPTEKPLAKPVSKPIATPKMKSTTMPTTSSTDYSETVKLSSKNGLLTVILTLVQGTTKFNTVQGDVKNVLVMNYEVVNGTSDNGQLTGENLYPGPTLQVNPGDMLIVYVINKLQKLTIPDFINPALTLFNESVPIIPPPLTESPFNLHVHGIHVSPQGNQDNVLIEIPAGKYNVYKYNFPTDQPQGLFWYHSHRHTLTESHVSRGLAGLLVVGRADGGLPVVTDNNLVVRTMSIQVTTVFDRVGGGNVFTNPFIERLMYASSAPLPGQLENGSYSPIYAPLNFLDSVENTTFINEWQTGKMGLMCFIPQQLKSFSSPTLNIPATPQSPQNQRDIQYVINGIFQPVMYMAPGETQIWSIGNIHSNAFARIVLRETHTGRLQQLKIVGVDGMPTTNVFPSNTENNTAVILASGNRITIAVTMPLEGDLVLELPTLTSNVATPPLTTTIGVAYKNIGKKYASGTIGIESIDPSLISYTDYFFMFPTQKLMTVKPTKTTKAKSVPFPFYMPLNAFTSYTDLKNVKADVNRNFYLTVTKMSYPYNTNDPLDLVFQSNGNVFPYSTLVQPHLNTVEEWFYENRGDEHPMHVHVNDLTITKLVDPNAPDNNRNYQPYLQDTVNLPSSKHVNTTTTITGRLSFKTLFLNYTGTYVWHCHRLSHEDAGLMTIVNVIAEVSIYAIAFPGNSSNNNNEGVDSTINVYNQATDQLLATVTPFKGFNGILTIACGDINGDHISDLVVGKYSQGYKSEVIAFSGLQQQFSTVIAHFYPFDNNFLGGIRIAVGDIDGTGTMSNIIVGTGPGIITTIKVYGGIIQNYNTYIKQTPVGTAPPLWAEFHPFSNPCQTTSDTSGVTSVATGLINYMGGRISIIVGVSNYIRAFTYSLLHDNTLDAKYIGKMKYITNSPKYCPDVSANFMPFGDSYNSGYSIATGFTDLAFGGSMTIIASQTSYPGRVGVFSSGSSLDGWPPLYGESPNAPDYYKTTFHNVLSEVVFANGSYVATSSNPRGADVFVSGAEGRQTLVKRFRFVPGNVTAKSIIDNNNNNTTKEFLLLKMVFRETILMYPSITVLSLGGI